MQRPRTNASLFLATLCIFMNSPGSAGATDLYVDDNGQGDPAPGDPSISSRIG